MQNNNNQDAFTLSLIKESLAIDSHYKLLHWLQGSMQNILPHHILISAWGDFSLELIEFDVVANNPLIRTTSISNTLAEPKIIETFKLWQSFDNKPLILDIENNDINLKEMIQLKTKNQFAIDRVNALKTALIHGVKDQRGSYDCLYILLSQDVFQDNCKEWLSILMPFIDCAFRQVDTLPIDDRQKEFHSDTQTEKLSKRECEIMELVSKGQSNVEIGIALNISIFTVKNHLQKIYKKLDAANRSQATFKYKKFIDQKS